MVQAECRHSNRRCGSKHRACTLLELNAFVAPTTHLKWPKSVCASTLFFLFPGPCHAKKRTEGLLEYCWLALHLDHALAQPISFAKQPVEPPGDVPGPPRWGKAETSQVQTRYLPTLHRRIRRFQNLGILEDREGKRRTITGSAASSASRPELCSN